MSESTALFLVGAPGVGKTTMLRVLIPDIGWAYQTPSPKWTVGDDWCAAGHYVGATFDGSDTIPYNGASAAVDYWLSELMPRKLSVFDGDRMSNDNVLTRVAAEVDRACCVLLVADDDTLADRRAARGSNQSPSWMKGRATKARRFFEKFNAADRVELGEGTPVELAATVRDFLEGR